MTPLRARWLALMAALALAVAVVLDSVIPGPALNLPWATILAVVVLSAVALVLAWQVRVGVKDSSRRRIAPIAAARVAVLAQTCAVFGALMGGWSLGILIHGLPLLRYRSVTDSFVLTVADLVAGILVCAAGCVAESWCKRPPDDDDGGNGRASRSMRHHDIPRGEGGYAADNGIEGRSR